MLGFTLRSALFVGVLTFSLSLCTACGKGGGEQADAPPTDTTAKAQPKEPEEKVEADRYWNDYARYLAGLPPLEGSVLGGIENRPEAKAHQQFFDVAWEKKKNNHLVKLTKWIKAEYPAWYESKQTAYYPFSGPDFMHIYTWFPNAKRYVMFGMEPEGSFNDVREVAPERLGPNLQRFEQSLNDILAFTFYKTIDMAAELKYTEIDGTMPAILAFMARMELTPLTARRIKVMPDGTVSTIDKSVPQVYNDGVVTGLEIKFRKGTDGPIQTLHYFSLDASNAGYTNQTDFHAYVKAMGPTQTFFKSASYLMQYNDFSFMREQIIATTQHLLQDDTGIPFKNLEANVWDYKYYGQYTRTIPLFAQRFQPDLRDYYAKNADKIKPIDFLLGYNIVYNECSLLAAEKKK